MLVDTYHIEIMKKDISSGLTFVHKIIIPLFWGCIGLYGIVGAAYLHKYEVLAVGSAIWLLGNLILWQVSIPLKKVWIDEENLYVSNYISMCVIPLSKIRDIVQLIGRGNLPRFRIRLELIDTTIYGKEITFVPKITAMSLDQIVALLKGPHSSSRSAPPAL
jgi:hypothetical protein